MYVDQNNDCVRDSAETGIASVMLEITPGPIYVTTDAEGMYEAWLPEGNYDIRPVAATGWSQACPANSNSQSISITASGQAFSNLNFGMQSLCQEADLQIEMGSNALRSGFRNNLIINFRNAGIQTAYQVGLDLVLPNELIALDASIPWSQVIADSNQSTYRWYWDSIPAFTSISLYVEDSVALSAPLGQSLSIQALASHTGTDCNGGDNQRLIQGEIVGAVDPNDKLVFPKGRGEKGWISASDTLTYKIRFQNVGTFPAARVEIVDTLSPSLDWESLELAAMSHEGHVHISEGGGHPLDI